MPQRENQNSIINGNSMLQSSSSQENSSFESSSDDDSDFLQSNFIENNQDEYQSETESVRQFKENDYIDFPDMRIFERPLGEIYPIPEHYIFKDLEEYQLIMKKLEFERFFKKLRHCLKKNIFKKENKLINEREDSTYEDFQWYQDYQVVDVQFNSDSLTLKVTASMNIQRYQKTQWEILNNQMMIFVNKKTKKYFIGKTIEQNKKQTSDLQQEDDPSLKTESFDSLVQDMLKKEVYKDITKEEAQEVEDILKEKYNDFDIINHQQTFKIKMNILSDIKEFLTNINQINKKYILLSPHEYWHSTQQIINCQKQFRKLKSIKFENQTIYAEKGEQKFPQYSFLKNQHDLIEEFQQNVEEEIQNSKNHLDKFQFQALKYALYNQNAVIQGPPGTGKTYLASHLVNVLSKLMQKHSKKPILIISKKNISLDQLLEQVKEINKKLKILRLGYQTTSEVIEKFTIKNSKGPSKKEVQIEGDFYINEMLQYFIERDINQDYYAQINSVSDDSIDNLSFQLKLKELEIEPILEQMRVYEMKRLKSQVNYENSYQQRLGFFMKKFQVIGMTMTGYHTYFEALQILEPEIIVVEEGSEIMESEFYPILTPNLKHLIQFGDHQQLRPIIRARSLQDQFNFKMSYFERLIKVNEIEYITLYQQKRMRPELANFTRLFYGNKYIDDPVAKSRDYVRDISSVGMYLLPHTYPDQRMNEGSYTNEFEAYYIKFFAKRLLQKYKYQQISVLCMYKSQKTLVQSKLQKLPLIQVYTVDEFQGNENDIIILSCVRSNRENSCGFLTESHRINVAFSRARIGFFCIGNFEMYRQKCQKWEEIVQLSHQQFSYGGHNQLYQYKKIFYLTQFQLELNFHRRNNSRPNTCNFCQEKVHIGLCKFNSSSQTLYNQLEYQFNINNNSIQKDLGADNLINQTKNLDFISMANQASAAAPPESNSEFPSFNSIFDQIDVDEKQNKIKQIQIEKKANQKQFLDEDESEDSFSFLKDRNQKKKKISQKQKKSLNITQTRQQNLTPSD